MEKNEKFNGILEWIRNSILYSNEPMNGIFSINGKLKMLGDGNGGIFTIPGFSQIQFEGFCGFVDRGLMEELSKFPKIEDTDQEMEFQLFVETYKLVEPLIKERDAVYESLTYSSELYVPAD
ncbi:hypothetical protein Syun_031734 [Stephania yunnanensis]|uniref:DNA-directed RNA polymerase n=1 Tax=Stephania yunnanensis TaxID=152371 RepID=A0AAP0HF53_9MAGN